MNPELLPYWRVYAPVQQPFPVSSRERKPVKAPTVIGWREWIALPELGVERIKAKIDTGAATSALHVSNIRSEPRDAGTWLTFEVHPIQRREVPSVAAGGWLVDERPVRNTSGKSDIRPVIETTIKLGTEEYRAEITLTRRDEMGFRMLLGRRALRRRFVVDSGRSFIYDLET